MKHWGWIGLFLFLPTAAFLSTQITSNTVQADYLKKEFYFIGNVFLNSPDVSLRAQELFYSARKLEAKGALELTQKSSQLFVKGDLLERIGSNIRISTPGGRVHSTDLKNQRTVESDTILLEKENGSWKKANFEGSPNLDSKSFQATAQKAIIYDTGDHTVFFSGLSNIQDKEQGNKIQSENIMFHEHSQKLIFSSSVSITDDQNKFLGGNSGEYRLEDKFLNLNGNVRYIGDVASIRSQKLTTDNIVDPKTSKQKLVYYFEGNIQLDYQSFQGTSDKVMVDPKEGYMELLGNVFLTGKNNGLKIRSDRAAISEKDKRSHFYNRVHFDSGKQHFNSDVAVYDDKTGIFTLMGNAHYSDGASQYDAQQIYLDNKTLSAKFVGMVSGLSTLGGLSGIQVDSSE